MASKKDSEKVLIFDTTLRDGEQALPSSLSLNEKLVIAKQLAKLNVDIIEAGFPVSSPGDFESVQRIAREVKGPVIAGLARCVAKDIEVAGKAVKPARKPRIHVFIGTSRIHREKKLMKSDDEVVNMAVRSVKLARKYCDDVEFSPEDTGRTERDFLYRIVEAAIKAGATTINLPDTVGYTVPEEFGMIVDDVLNNVSNIDRAVISVHCHNDLGMASANSVTAALCGARQIECAVNGLGERAGNCALEEVVMTMKVRGKAFGLDTNINTREIYNTSRLVSRVCNIPVQPNKAIIGGNAFSHSSGIHQDGVLKHQKAYEIMTPQAIGLKQNKLNLTSRSGRHAVSHRLKELGYGPRDYKIDKIYKLFLELADKKGTVYDDDLLALIEIGDAAIKETYTLEYLNAVSGHNTVPTATIKLKTPKGVMEEAATGDGPVDATYNAINRIVGFRVKLKDYKLTAMTGGKEALGHVDIIGEYKKDHYHGSGSSTDIVEASALAYLNVVNKIVNLKKRK